MSTICIDQATESSIRGESVGGEQSVCAIPIDRSDAISFKQVAAERLVSTPISRRRELSLATFHILLFAMSYILAYWVRFDGAIPESMWKTAWETLPLILVVKVVSFLILKCHRGWWRSVGFAEMMSLVEAAILGSMGFYVFVILRGCPVSRSVLLIDCIMTIVGLCGTRGAERMIRERYGRLGSTRSATRVLIVGVGESAGAIARQIDSRSNPNLKIVGYLDPDRAFQGRFLAGSPVIGTPDDLLRIASRYNVSLVLIPTPSTPAHLVRTLVDACKAARIKYQIVPELDALLSGDLSLHPRDIAIEDLLCREPVQVDDDSITHILSHRTVLVTGAAGSIGSEICRQALAFNPTQLVLLDLNENGLFYLERELLAQCSTTKVIPCVAGVTDIARLRQVFDQYRPQIVFHAAAHKHVPLMEAHPGEAVKNNVFGTRAVVDETLRCGAEAFVMISTDKAVNPTSVMGACKRLAEFYVQTLAGLTNTRLVTVRFGNVLGSNGSVVSVFKDQIKNGGPVTVTDPDITRYFMTIPEAARLVLQAGAQGQGGEIFVLDMGKPIRMLDLARDMVRIYGQGENQGIEIVFTGLRPGEKLYEELYDEGEQPQRTSHPKIFSAKRLQYSADQLRAGLSRLAEAIPVSENDVIKILVELVPGYRPERTRVTTPRSLESKQKKTHNRRSNNIYTHN